MSQAATSQATVSRTAVSRTAVSRTALSREAGPFAQQRKQQNNCTWRLNSWKLSHINDLEDELKRHPLALYPHLEEYIPYNVGGGREERGRMRGVELVLVGFVCGLGFYGMLFL